MAKNNGGGPSPVKQKISGTMMCPALSANGTAYLSNLECMYVHTLVVSPFNCCLSYFTFTQC